MRSFEGPSGATYHHNSDFSGSIKLSQERIHPGDDIVIPFVDIRALYLEYLRQQAIGKLEEYSFAELEEELPFLVGLPESVRSRNDYP